MEHNELKPCPFCGREAEMIEIPHIPRGTDYTPRCKHTWCCGRLTKKWARKEDAIRFWNRGEQTMELNREQIIKALECYIKKPHISECEKGCIYYEKSFGCYCCALPLEETLIENGLSLIKELTEENERLRAENKKAQISIDTFRELADKHALQYELRADKVKRLERFKSYFDDLFETGLEVANWHENGELMPFDDFYISALDCMRE